MNPNQNHHTKKGNPSGNHEKSASKGDGNARRPPPAAAVGGAKSSSTGVENQCSHGVRCKNAHCENQHPKEWVRPERCMYGQSCTILGKGKCPLLSANCDNYQNCPNPECDKNHDKRRKVSAPASAPAPESAPVSESVSVPVPFVIGGEDFPSLSDNVDTPPPPIQMGTGWANMVGGGGALTEKPDFSKRISAIVAIVPDTFGENVHLLEKRLKGCSTVKEFRDMLTMMHSAFTTFSTEAAPVLEMNDETEVFDLIIRLFKALFGEDCSFPKTLPQEVNDLLGVVIEISQNFSKVYDEVSPSLVDETLESSNCVSSTDLVGSVTQVHHAMRQLEFIIHKVNAINPLQSGVLLNMFQMLSSVSSSKISLTRWCLESLIESMLASANNLLKEVMTADEEKKLEEQKRLYQLLLNPKCELSGTAEHLIACLLALSFHTNNAAVYGNFVSSLSKKDRACLESNLNKYFECLVSQIFKSLSKKAEITNECFRDSNEEYLMGLLNSAFASLNNMIQHDSKQILMFLRKFSNEQSKHQFFPPAFVNFAYTTHVFNGNEGANPMVKLWAWYASVLKEFFKLEVSCENLEDGVRFFVFNDHVDERGDTRKENVDITGPVMHFLFEMVCLAEVFRQNRKDFPYGNISNRFSLAVLLNKAGRNMDPKFVCYSKSKDGTEQAACPYDPLFKRTIGCESNSDVVQCFFKRTLELKHAMLDESYMKQLVEIKRSFLPDPEKHDAFLRYAALFCAKDRADISTILRGMQILLSNDAEDSRNKENLCMLKSLLKEDYSCLHKAIFDTLCYFLKSGSENEANEVVRIFLEEIKEVVDMVLSSGITFEDITMLHALMRKFYMSYRRELYLHPCLIAIILALTQRYKVSFQDVYNMVRSAMKNNRWKAFMSFPEDSQSQIRKAVSDLQPQTSEFSFRFALDRSAKNQRDKIELSGSQSFWCMVNLVDVKSNESTEVLNKIQSLVDNVVSLILFNEVFEKQVKRQPSSIIDQLNNVITLRLMGPTFKHLMRLFGITDLKIKDISSEQPPASDILTAFSSGVGFQTMGNVTQSMFDCMLFDHRRKYPGFMNLHKQDRRSALELIRKTVTKEIVEKFLKFGLGLTVDLTDLPVINSFVLFDIVRKKMSLFDLPFFKKLLQVINDGLYANSFHSIQARRARFSANKLFLESQSGDAVGKMTFFDAIHEVPDDSVHEVPDDSDDRFQNPDEVIRALEELFSDGKNKYGFDIPSKLEDFDIGSKLQNFRPSIMACQKLIPLFPPPTEGKYTEFPKDNERIISCVLGNTANEECGGIGIFNELYPLSNEALVFQYANLISLGNEDLEVEVLSSEFYARFLYLLQALQYFSSIDVEEMVKEELAQREPSDK